MLAIMQWSLNAVTPMGSSCADTVSCRDLVLLYVTLLLLPRYHISPCACSELQAGMQISGAHSMLLGQGRPGERTVTVAYAWLMSVVPPVEMRIPRLNVPLPARLHSSTMPHCRPASDSDLL